MAYGLKYVGSYDTFNNDECMIEIYQKDYTDNVFPIELADEPVIQTYQTNEVYTPISGCSLSLKISNAGNISFLDFYGEDDNFIKIKHYKNGNLTFEGFLVLDNCQELMVDYRHELDLTFTDNLGLLKDVLFNATNFQTNYVYEPAGFALGAPNGVILSDNSYVPEIGIPFTITGTTFNGTFTPVSIVAGSGFYTITVAETVTTHSAEFGFLSVVKDFDFYEFNNLLSIIQGCLINTGLQLNTTIYTGLFEQSHAVEISFLQQTYINTQMFLQNDTFDNCWDVLTKILSRFGLTLFQSNGQWVIIRFNEIRYGSIDGFIYDSNFTLIGTDTFNSEVNFGFEQLSYPINISAVKRITRPYKFVKDTFNYQQPKYLLKNYDLMETGLFLRTYTTGSGVDLKTYYEYVAVGWTAWFGAGASPGVFIRIVYDYLENEIDRCLVIKGDSGDTARAVVGTPFEVSATDIIELSFSFTVNINIAGPVTNIVALRITDGTTNNYADEDTSVNWKSTIGWNYQFSFGYDADITQNVKIRTGQIPFDSLFYVYLPTCRPNGSSTDETEIRDIRLTYIPSIALSTKVIGHTHTQTQDFDIKNNSSEDILVDDCIRRALRGTLFLSSYTGVLRNLTEKWYRKKISTSEDLKVGEIITFDKLALFRVPRALIEGEFKGVQAISPLAIVNYFPFDSIRFIISSLEIRYRSDTFNCVINEICYNEDNSLLTSEYDFLYIYDTK